jgi:two-component system sensor histidine kinase DegS
MGEAVIRLSMDDNGKGFDVDSLQKDSNLGMKLIKERAEMVGGTFEMDSAPGKGSRIILSIPAHS